MISRLHYSIIVLVFLLSIQVLLAKTVNTSGVTLKSNNNAPPVNTMLVPNAGNIAVNQNITLTSTYTDLGGADNLKTCYLLVNTSFSTDAGYLFYNALKNRLYLRSSDSTTLIGGYSPGKAQTIDNGFITLNCRLTTVQKIGNTLIINWSIIFKQSFSDSVCNAWMRATNKDGLVDPWKQMGTFMMIPDPTPRNVSLSPNNGTITINQQTTLTSSYSDPAGNENIKSCYLMLNTGTTATGAGFFFYNPVKNKLYLRQTDSSTMIGGFTPGSANVIDNGSIILYCADTTVQKIDNDLTINWSIALKSYFANESCTASMQVTNLTGQAGPWKHMGDFSIYNPALVERVSISSIGEEGNGASDNPAISSDGRYVVFQSLASNLTAGDTNGCLDVFIRDRDSSTTERVSVSSSNEQGNGNSYNPSISADGRYIVFESTASNLISEDTNGNSDIFIYDRINLTTERISVTSLGTQMSVDSHDPCISADGTCVAFTSGYDLMIRDFLADTTETISSGSGAFSLSFDGRYVAFEASSSLLPGGNRDAYDVYVTDRSTDVTERISVSSTGVAGDGFSHNPVISANGRYVTFTSYSSNLTPILDNWGWNIYVRDRIEGTTEYVDTGNYGYYPSISSDGRYITFAEIYAVGRIHLWDQITGIEKVISNGSHITSISGDGNHLAFDSEASDVVPNDTNDSSDVFVYPN
ncbi:MAG: TolB family protein [Armatimonadota bacterium]